MLCGHTVAVIIIQLPTYKFKVKTATEMFQFLFQFSFYVAFNIEKKCVFTILKAINRLVLQDMGQCRVHQQLTFMKCAHVSNIVTEANHNGAVCVLRTGFETRQIFKD